MADDVRVDFLNDIEAGDLAHSGARYATGMNFDFDAARMRPVDVALSLAVGQQAVIIKNELDQLDSQRLDFVEIFFG